jgi:hypothetical protein
MQRKPSLARVAKGLVAMDGDAVRREVAMLSKRHAVYSALFRGEDGELTDAAKWFFKELDILCGRRNRMGVHHHGFEPDARRAEWNAARADLVDSVSDGLYLDGKKLVELRKELKGKIDYE